MPWKRCDPNREPPAGDPERISGFCQRRGGIDQIGAGIHSERSKEMCILHHALVIVAHESQIAGSIEAARGVAWRVVE